MAVKQSCSPHIVMCESGIVGREWGEVGQKKILLRVKTNTAARFRVCTSVTDPFLLGCVNDTKRSPKVSLKEFRARVKKSEEERKNAKGQRGKIQRVVCTWVSLVQISGGMVVVFMVGVKGRRGKLQRQTVKAEFICACCRREGYRS